MVECVRQGSSQRSIAKRFGVSLAVVQRWVMRAEDKPLDEVDWDDLHRGPHTVANRTSSDIEEQVLSLRVELKGHSDLGDYGAIAIRQEMVSRDLADVPSVRTINRILERRGVFDSRRRVRRPSPPIGWYLPDVASGSCELDQFDTVSGLVIEGGIEVEVLNAISLHGGLIGSWPWQSVKASCVSKNLIEHWSAFGCPDYVQFDNGTIFQGPHHYPDVVSSVMRLCLSLGVAPVFAPPRESGFQAAVESLNNRWQRKVWERFHYETLESLEMQSDRYVAAVRRKSILRREAAPERHPIPGDWKLDLQARPEGKIVFLRRTSELGQA
jgi:putative transposase